MAEAQADDSAELAAEVEAGQVFEIDRQARREAARRCVERAEAAAAQRELALERGSPLAAMLWREVEAAEILEWGWHLFPDKFTIPFCTELHEYFVSIMDLPFTATEAPRGHAKTLIKCFLIPMYLALNRPRQFLHYLNVQATEEKALDINRSIKYELEHNRELREIYGDVRTRERWTDGQFVIKHAEDGPFKGAWVVFTAVSAGQSLRGLNYRNRRPDYVVVDDLYNEEDIHNPETTEKKNAWFWSTLYPARAKSRRCSLHVQGTAINNYDLLEKLKGQENVKSRTFRAITDELEQTVLWPELNTYDSLMADKVLMGSVIFYREMMNERRDDATAIVKQGWIRYYKPHEWKNRLSDQFFVQEVLMINDPSIGEKLTSDFNAVVLMYKCGWADGSGNEYYIARANAARLTKQDRINLLTTWAGEQPERYPVNEVRIEGIGGFKDYANDVIRMTNLPVKVLDKVPDKIAHLENKSNYFENGKVFISEDIDQVTRDQMVYQLTTNKPKHDDLRDAVLHGLDDNSGLWRWV